MQRPALGSAKGAVAFSDRLNVSVTAGSLLGLPADSNGRKRFGSATHPRKWLRINEAGKLNYITVSACILAVHATPAGNCF